MLCRSEQPSDRANLLTSTSSTPPSPGPSSRVWTQIPFQIFWPMVGRCRPPPPVPLHAVSRIGIPSSRRLRGGLPKRRCGLIHEYSHGPAERATHAM